MMSNQTKSYSDYSKAFQALDQQDQDYILGVFAKTKNDPVDSTQKISKREKLIQEGKELIKKGKNDEGKGVLDKSRAILQDLIDSSAWQNFRAKRQELASTLVGDADNDTAAINQEVIKLQSALDEVQNKLKKNQIKTNAIEKKLLGSSYNYLTDAHPKIKEAIDSGEIKVYVKKSDGSYIVDGQKFEKNDFYKSIGEAYKSIGKESIYVITEECDYLDGKKRTIPIIFARNEGIQRAFELQGAQQTNYTNAEELTKQGLKPLFAKYKDRAEYKNLFNCANRLKLNETIRGDLHKLFMEINLPETAVRDSDGSPMVSPGFLYLRLPLSFNGKRLCLMEDDFGIYFEKNLHDDLALPVFAFAN